MSYRDFEKAALRKLLEIDSEGPFVERQKVLAARGWEKKCQRGASGKTLEEEEKLHIDETDEERLERLIETMEERHRSEIKELQSMVHSMRDNLGNHCKFAKNRFSEVTKDVDNIEVSWDEDAFRFARSLEARHAEEMAALEWQLAEIQNSMYRRGMTEGKGRSKI